MASTHKASTPRPTRSAASPSPTTACGSSSRTPSCGAAAPRRCASGSSTDTATTVRDFDVEHEKRMHLIVARRDLTGFQHLHPEQAADGTWTTPRAARRRRLLPAVRRLLPRRRGADAGHRPARRRRRRPARRCPPPAATAVSDGGYDVRLDAGDAAPGRGGRPALHDHQGRRAGPTPSPTSARAATSWRCARATWRSCTCTRLPTTRVGFARDVPDRGPLPAVPAVQARGPRPDRRLHAGGELTMAAGARARRAADHRHDLRVVREPDRAQAQQARRRHARRSTTRPRRPPSTSTPTRRRRSSSSRPSRRPATRPRCRRRAGGRAEEVDETAPLRQRLLVSLALDAAGARDGDDPAAAVRQLAVAVADARRPGRALGRAGRSTARRGRTSSTARRRWTR